MGVIIVNQDDMSAKLLRYTLELASYEDVQIAENAAQALAMAREDDVEAVLLDTDLPDMSGYDLCAELRSRRFRGVIMFISDRTSPADRVKGFEAGADDFMSKPVYPHELLARISAVSRRHSQQDYQALGTILKIGDAQLSITDLTFQVDGREPVRLTPTETRILECLMRNSNITVSRETLIERTWGYEFFGDSNRVDVYIGRLRNKIELNHSKPEYLHTVRRVGYIFRPPNRNRIAPNEYPVDAMRGNDGDPSREAAS